MSLQFTCISKHESHVFLHLIRCYFLYLLGDDEVYDLWIKTYSYQEMASQNVSTFLSSKKIQFREVQIRDNLR